MISSECRLSVFSCFLAIREVLTLGSSLLSLLLSCLPPGSSLQVRNGSFLLYLPCLCVMLHKSIVFMHWHLVRKNRRLREQVEQGLIPPPPDMLPMGKQLLTTAQLEVFPLRTVPKKPSAPPPASKRNSIITSDGQVLDEDCCVICLEKVEEGDIVRELPCKHEYHQGCIGTSVNMHVHEGGITQTYICY